MLVPELLGLRDSLLEALQSRGPLVGDIPTILKQRYAKMTHRTYGKITTPEFVQQYGSGLTQRIWKQIWKQE